MMLLSFALIPMWWQLPQPPAPFSAGYPLGFVISLTMLASTGLWILAGLPGLRQFCRNSLQLAWLAALLLLLLWLTLSQTWGFVALRQPGVSSGAALQAWLVGGFVLALACAGPPIRIVLGVLLGVMLLHGAIAVAQVWQQSSIGLAQFGEFRLDPARSGISVVQTGDLRWLRPHGLLPHPNILAGFVMVALFGACAWAWQARRSLPLALVCMVFGLWVLLLSFSRGAWLGFGGGALIILPWLLRDTGYRRPLLILSACILGTGLLFVAQYQSLLLARAGAGVETTELRSIVDRSIFNAIAGVAIVESPVLGVGIGQYPWYASNYLFYNTDYDLRGTQVHNVYLGIAAELGLIGSVIAVGVFSLGLRAILNRCQQAPDPWRIACLGGVTALMIVGFVDHYPWTMIGFQALWFGLMALGMQAPQLSVAEAEATPSAQIRNLHP